LSSVAVVSGVVVEVDEVDEVVGFVGVDVPVEVDEVVGFVGVDVPVEVDEVVGFVGVVEVDESAGSDVSPSFFSNPARFSE
jgi:hypothetical protein